jgi:predicted transcriptional regulator
MLCIILLFLALILLWEVIKYRQERDAERLRITMQQAVERYLKNKYPETLTEEEVRELQAARWD